MSRGKNVLGGDLKCCCADPMTGFYRTGYCETGEQDRGVHTVCVEATAEFLEFSRNVGNDLSTPMPEYRFPGVKPGQRWCLCARRWQQALEAGVAPNVDLEASHIASLEFVSLDDLQAHALPSASEN